MSVDAVFQGGPADGIELALIGHTPDYLLVMPNPASDSAMTWIVVGADFDDHWPGQIRYERTGVGLAANERDELDLSCVIYSYRPACPRCGMVSANPRDHEEGYCGRCHDWTMSHG